MKLKPPLLLFYDHSQVTNLDFIGRLTILLNSSLSKEHNINSENATFI